MNVYYSPKLDEVMVFGDHDYGYSFAMHKRMQGRISFRKVIKHGPEYYGFVKIGKA